MTERVETDWASQGWCFALDAVAAGLAATGVETSPLRVNLEPTMPLPPSSGRDEAPSIPLDDAVPPHSTSHQPFGIPTVLRNAAADIAAAGD